MSNKKELNPFEGWREVAEGHRDLDEKDMICIRDGEKSYYKGRFNQKFYVLSYKNGRFNQLIARAEKRGARDLTV